METVWFDRNTFAAIVMDEIVELSKGIGIYFSGM